MKVLPKYVKCLGVLNPNMSIAFLFADVLIAYELVYLASHKAILYSSYNYGKTGKLLTSELLLVEALDVIIETNPY